MSSLAEPAGCVEAGDRGLSRPRRRIGAVALLAGTLVSVALLTVSVTRPVAPLDSPLLDRAAPAFDLPTLDGGRLALEDLRGSPIVLNFWASWCIPCREEAPLLAAMDREYGPRGVRVLGVVYQDSAESARSFMQTYDQAFPGLIDADGRTAIDYGVFGIPETFFIDAGGTVRGRQWGVLTPASLRRWIEAILP